LEHDDLGVVNQLIDNGRDRIAEDLAQAENVSLKLTVIEARS
jgi:hypothetical protein